VVLTHLRSETSLCAALLEDSPAFSTQTRSSSIHREEGTAYSSRSTGKRWRAGSSGGRRRQSSFALKQRFSWVMKSPPYYGMKTYLTDQWLRGWFLGASPTVDYRHSTLQMDHGSPEKFTSQVIRVWTNVNTVCEAHASLVCRLGGIRDRKAHPVELVLDSLRQSPWRVSTVWSPVQIRPPRPCRISAST
jgi:hypothetical protein